MKGLKLLAGILFLIVVAVIMVYYFMFFVPYSARLVEYDQELVTAQKLSSRCNTGMGKPVVEGKHQLVDGECNSAEEPAQPSLPFGSVIQAIGDFTGLDVLRHINNP